MKLTSIALVALALGVALGQYGEDEDYGYGGEEGGGGGYGGEDEEMPPPSGPVQELLSVEDFDAFLDNNDASVVGAFTAKEVTDPTAEMPEGWDAEEDGEWTAPTIENPALTSFTSASSSVPGYRYAYTTEPAVMETIKSKKGGVYLFRSPKFVSVEHGDRPRERYPADNFEGSGFSNWLAAKAQPLVGEYTSSSKDRYKSAVLVVFLKLDFDQNAKSVKYVLKRARKVATAFKGKLSIALASTSAYEMDDFGLKSEKPNTDVLMGISDSKGNFYTGPDVAFTEASLKAFAESYLAGGLKPYEKPPYEPPAQDEGMGDAEDAEGYEGGEGEDEMKDEP